MTTFYIYKGSTLLGTVNEETEYWARQAYSLWSDIDSHKLIARTTLEREQYLRDIKRADDDRRRANFEEYYRDTR